MSLTPEQIKALLNKNKNRNQGRGRKPKNYIDTSERTVVVWFKLAHKLMDDETMEPAKCSNPNCSDTRHIQMCAEVNSVLMCRRCFLDGYQLVIEGQQAIDEAVG